VPGLHRFDGSYQSNAPLSPQPSAQRKRESGVWRLAVIRQATIGGVLTEFKLAKGFALDIPCARA